jgi:hypothetical protein
MTRNHSADKEADGHDETWEQPQQTTSINEGGAMPRLLEQKGRADDGQRNQEPKAQ